MTLLHISIGDRASRMRPFIVFTICLALTQARIHRLATVTDGEETLAATLNNGEQQAGQDRQFPGIPGIPGMPGGGSGGGGTPTDQLCKTVCLACNVAAPIALGKAESEPARAQITVIALA